MRSHAAGVLAAAMLVAAAGCSQDATGTPRPSSGGPTSTSNADGASLKELDPCALVTPAEARELGGPEQGTPEPLTSSRGCGWTVSGSHSFGVALFDDKGLGDLTLTGQRTTITIGGRPAERVEENDGPGGCVVIFPITDKSVAQADVHARTDTAKACQVAEQVARVIAPKLP